MIKKLLFNGLKICVTIGILISLAGQSSTLAQIPVEKTMLLDYPILENTKPVAQTEQYSMTTGTTLTVPAPGVLQNDYDPEGDPITAVLVGSTAMGILVLSPDGSFVYTPSAGYIGDDHFTYKVSDGALFSNPVMVMIHVTGGDNTAPVAEVDAYTTLLETTLIVEAVFGVLSNDYDADGDLLTAVQAGVPAHGSLSLDEDGSFEYTPDAGYIGSDHFSYQAYDGMDYSVTTVVAIEVTGGENTAPEAIEDTYTTDIDVPLTVDALNGVLVNDLDEDGDLLTAALVISPVNGSLDFHTDGSFVYTPDLGYFGDDHFTYRAFDGMEESPPAMVTITVSTLNTPPVATEDTYLATSNIPLVVDALTGVLANDTDLDGDVLIAQVLGNPANGTLILYTDGSFIYTPNAGFTGSDMFTYRAFDGLEFSSPVIVTIEVNAPPVAVPDIFTVGKNKSLTVNTPNGVLSNDTDANGDHLTAELVADVSNGTLTFYPDGSFVYVPNQGYVGVDQFTYQACDDLICSAPVMVTIHVLVVNIYYLALVHK